MLDLLPQLPADPILGLSQAFAQDDNPDKVDLGVGVYKDETGQTPILAAVIAAERQRLQQETSKAYTNPAGYPGANAAVNQLLLGQSHTAMADSRVRTIQTPGGCGALRVAAELIQRARPGATVWVSTPTWANHIPLLGNAGLTLQEYPYYNYEQHGLEFEAMLRALEQAEPGDLVLLHACCHNPSGADLSQEQWQKLAELMQDRQLVGFIDTAYQGFGEGLAEDAYGIRLLAETLPELLVATSFSKNFGLYRERAGALTVVMGSCVQADAVQSQMLNVTRGIYSMPPSHGSAIIDIILHSPELTNQWQSELTQMRRRIQSLRQQLVNTLHKKQSQDFSFITREKGMFSFLGLSPQQVQTLRRDYSIYMTDNSRINVAGLSADRLDYVGNAIAHVLAE